MVQITREAAKASLHRYFKMICCPLVSPNGKVDFFNNDVTPVIYVTTPLPLAEMFPRTELDFVNCFVLKNPVLQLTPAFKYFYILAVNFYFSINLIVLKIETDTIRLNILRAQCSLSRDGFCRYVKLHFIPGRAIR